MKKNDYLIAIVTLVYSLLFYHQSGGVNFFIFSIILVTLSLFRNKNLFHQSDWLAAAAGVLLSGFAVFYYATLFTIATNLAAIILLAAISFHPASSIFIAAINGVYSWALAVPSIIVYLLAQHNLQPNGRVSKLKKLLLWVLPVMLSSIFLWLYREANPLFKEVTDKITFNFISTEWILFTFFGGILMYGFFYQKVIQQLLEADEKNTDHLQPVSEEAHANSIVASVISFGSEMYTGIALFALLNILLFSVNAIDIYYLYIIQTLPSHLTLSAYLHDGTNALIISILLAIGIILFFFRGRVNFVTDNQTIKWLSYVWILQNIFLIVTTASRNWFYISNFGLTHKRLGVYIFLTLCIIGLVTSLMKVVSVKSNWFLFRKNSWAGYSFLIIATLINWDGIIAGYNLNLAYSKNVKPDTSYLAKLSYTALPVLLQYYELELTHTTKLRIFDPYLETALVHRCKEVKNEVNQQSWQSRCLIKLQACKRMPVTEKMLERAETSYSHLQRTRSRYN